ncbi:MAG: hypothetical protein IKL73_05320 [Lachnospiraceae bacterium]|nr:hypothetical protein [Lachnospiraceae bacterium]
MSKIQNFMQVYMYELEQFLSTKKEELKTVSFQSDEANTDRPLKEFLKSVIQREFMQIPLSTAISTIIFNDEIGVNVEELKNIRILRVLLPEEITDEIKAIVSANKNAVYTNPDMCLEILVDGKVVYETIELKSTKQDSIPGSSIQQVVPNEWVIFIKHSNTKIEITTGQYIHAINSKMQFPDRSPRPQVSFKEMQSWNQAYRIFNYAQLVYKKDDDESVKYDLINDWQGVLSKRWIDMLFNATTVRANEPWFNNNMRKFIVSFLEKYEQLDGEDKEAFIAKVKALIKDE